MEFILYLHFLYLLIMKAKKIITWIIFILSAAGFFYKVKINDDNSSVTILFFFVSFVAITLLIQFYTRKPSWRNSWYLILIPIVIGIFISFLGDPIAAGIFFLISGVIIISLFFVVITRKVELIIFYFLIISLFGIIFKYFHWPGASVMITSGFIIPGILFFFIIYQNISEYDARTNRFLNFFKNFICLTLIVSFLGLNFKMMHWPGGNLLKTISLPMFLLSIVSLVFLLPGSNFIEWSKELKRMFYRALLIPLFYMTIITAMANVFPDTFKNIFFSESKNITNGFHLNPYEIPLIEGMELTKTNR